jgi:hypothetical protein
MVWVVLPQDRPCCGGNGLPWRFRVRSGLRYPATRLRARNAINGKVGWGTRLAPEAVSDVTEPSPHLLVGDETDLRKDIARDQPSKRSVFELATRATDSSRHSEPFRVRHPRLLRSIAIRRSDLPSARSFVIAAIAPCSVGSGST